MHIWEARYGIRPSIAVYTPDKNLITDSLNRWNVTFHWPLNELIEMFQHPGILEKYAARVHDEEIDLDYSHCLYVKEPCAIDLSDLYTCMDLKHTVYSDSQDRFAIYRRDTNFLIKKIDFNSRPKTGVIFIECWEENVDWSWHYDQNISPTDNFYQRMINNLWQYNLHDFVFFSSGFGDHKLTSLLTNWASRPWAEHINSIDTFTDHLKHTDIKHWIVVGGHWGICTHDKELGFFNLLKLKQQDPSLHFYSLPDSTVKFLKNHDAKSLLTVCTKQDYVNDCLTWNFKDNLDELLVK